jgi:hypothetical protein
MSEEPKPKPMDAVTRRYFINAARSAGKQYILEICKKSFSKGDTEALILKTVDTFFKHQIAIIEKDPKIKDQIADKIMDSLGNQFRSIYDDDLLTLNIFLNLLEGNVFANLINENIVKINEIGGKIDANSLVRTISSMQRGGTEIPGAAANPAAVLNMAKGANPTALLNTAKGSNPADMLKGLSTADPSQMLSQASAALSGQPSQGDEKETEKPTPPAMPIPTEEAQGILIDELKKSLPDGNKTENEVKTDIYDRVLKAIEFHMNSIESKNKILDIANPFIQKYIDQLSSNEEIKKQMITFFMDKQIIFSILRDILQTDKENQINQPSPGNWLHEQMKIKIASQIKEYEKPKSKSLYDTFSIYGGIKHDSIKSKRTKRKNSRKRRNRRRTKKYT